MPPGPIYAQAPEARSGLSAGLESDPELPPQPPDTRGHQGVGVVNQDLDHVGVTSLVRLDQHGQVVLELVVGVGALLEEDLHHVKVAAGAGEAQGCVVIVCCLLVDIRAPADEDLHSAEVTSPQQTVSVRRDGQSLHIVMLRKFDRLHIVEQNQGSLIFEGNLIIKHTSKGINDV